MSQVHTAKTGSNPENARHARIILGLAVASGALYAFLALSGDLRERLSAYFVSYALLAALMLCAWRVVRGRARALRWALGAALAFRLVAALGQPSLSDDVYRYVWDGRVQLHGIHPYRYAPLDPALAELRDENWAKINHPELKTIYPPLAEMAFLLLAASGAGPVGFKLAMGLADFAVVLALGLLLRQRSLPRDRLLLYAWNPLAVLETSGSGHVEPLGVLLVLLAGAWIINRRPVLSTLALAAAFHVKVLPGVLLPGRLRRDGRAAALLLLPALLLPFVPYALNGPPVGQGMFEYARSWERNATIYAGVQAAIEWIDPAPLLKRGIAAAQQRLDDWPIPWDFLYRHVWPRDLARLLVLVAAGAWVLRLSSRSGLDPARESLLVLGGVLLLAPTLHPWYLLWVLPFAAAFLSWGWLLLGVTVPLAYVGGAGDVPFGVKCAEYLPPLAVALWAAARGHRIW